MAESVIISTLTTSIVTDADFEICSEYLGQTVDCGDGEFVTELPNIRLAQYYDNEGNVNGIVYEEGDLMTIGVNMPLENDIWLNNQGELIIKGDDNEAYYIDDNGDLIYAYCVLACLDEYYECDYVDDDFVNH